MRPPLSFVLVFAVAGLLASFGCQSKPAEQAAPATEKAANPGEASAPEAAQASPEAAADPAYRADFDNICHSESRSGADQQEGQRHVTIAMWLGSTIKTDRAREFLATLSRTPPADKAALLESERQRLGLDECPLVETWRS